MQGYLFSRPASAPSGRDKGKSRQSRGRALRSCNPAAQGEGLLPFIANGLREGMRRPRACVAAAGSRRMGRVLLSFGWLPRMPSRAAFSLAVMLTRAPC